MFLEFFSTFLIGASLYGTIEILFRSHTHWTMILTGGICFMFLYLVATRTQWPRSVKCLAGAFIITVIEFIVGCIVNIQLQWNIWDYSGSFFNIMGQVCPLFMIFWFILCIPGMWLSKIINTLFHTVKTVDS